MADSPRILSTGQRQCSSKNVSDFTLGTDPVALPDDPLPQQPFAEQPAPAVPNASQPAGPFQRGSESSY